MKPSVSKLRRAIPLSNRSAQMEMVGLVIIVILITLGILFMAQFALKDDPAKKIFTRKGLATSTMSAIMKMSVQEPGCPTLPQVEKDLLEDCALNYPPHSEFSFAKFHCRSQHPCDFLQDFIAERLEETLGQWNKKYEFQSRIIGEEEFLVKIESSRGGCPPKQERDTSSPFPLNTRIGLVESIIYLCD